jgi:hypothetical protein
MKKGSDVEREYNSGKHLVWIFRKSIDLNPTKSTSDGPSPRLARIHSVDGSQNGLADEQ